MLESFIAYCDFACCTTLLGGIMTKSIKFPLCRILSSIFMAIGIAAFVFFGSHPPFETHPEPPVIYDLIGEIWLVLGLSFYISHLTQWCVRFFSIAFYVSMTTFIFSNPIFYYTRLDHSTATPTKIPPLTNYALFCFIFCWTVAPFIISLVREFEEKKL